MSAADYDEPSDQDVHVWTEFRDRAISEFAGQTPRAADEQAILEIFLAQPMMVSRAIDGIAAALAAGRVTWAWSALAARLRKEVTPAAEAVVVGKDERTGRAARAERFLRAAGFHLDRADHLVDELFGRGGLLEAFAGDELLKRQMLELWESLQPVRLEVEAAAVERAQRWQVGRDRLADLELEQQAAREAAALAARVPARPSNPFLDGSLNGAHA